MQKIQKLTQNVNFKRFLSLFMVFAIMGCMAIPAFAEDAVTENPVSQISSAFSNVTGTIKISNVVSVIGIVLATAVGFVLFWWGLRKVIKVIMSAFSKGKVRV